MESATTAESRLSSAARITTVKAEGNKGRITATAALLASNATTEPGTFGINRGINKINTSDPSPMPADGRSIVLMFSPITFMR